MSESELERFWFGAFHAGEWVCEEKLLLSSPIESVIDESAAIVDAGRVPGFRLDPTPWHGIS